MREFYAHYFGARIELMHMSAIPETNDDPLKQHIGIIHIAISVGSKKRVIELTHRLEADGYEVIGKPRTTGDGYFESVVFDPERNRIEITV